MGMALDMAQMVSEVRENLKLNHFYILNIFCLNNFPKKSSPGGVLALGLLLAVALDLAQMVLEVRKNPKPTKFYMLNNFWFSNCLKISIPGDVRAQVLQEPVGASHADQGRKSGVPRTFLGPGGQAGSDGTPHLGFGPSPTIPQGGG